MKVWFDVVNKDGSVLPMGFCFNHACLFGWAGRNKEEVRKHAEELAEHGIRGPKNMPEHFLISPNMITHDPEIVCVGEKTCGEIEFFFFRREGVIYVGVGSEHTDRALEAVDMIKSKAVCHKPMSRQIWKYEDVVDHWDDIQLTAWQVNEEGKKVLYQDSPCGSLLKLEELLKRAEEIYGRKDLDDIIIWSGTIPAVDGLVYGSWFGGEMHDKKLGRKLAFEYSVRTVPADFE